MKYLACHSVYDIVDNLKFIIAQDNRTRESPFWEIGGYMDMYPEFMVESLEEGLELVRTRYLPWDPSEFLHRENTMPKNQR